MSHIMDAIAWLFDFIMHIDSHLIQIVHDFGNWTYVIVFAIIFVETGAVILPFLPGDSLLFAASALAANPAYGLNPWLFPILFFLAAVLGDSLNFYIGKNSEKILSKYKLFSRFISQESLEKGREFFEEKGSIAIILARFMPIIRTFVPFVAGSTKFPYNKFAKYNIFAAFIWVFICCAAGHFFGNIPVVQEHFSVIVLGIIGVSLIPAIVGFVKTKLTNKRSPEQI